jgi:hypothetical protein
MTTGINQPGAALVEIDSRSEVTGSECGVDMHPHPSPRYSEDSGANEASPLPSPCGASIRMVLAVQCSISQAT